MYLSICILPERLLILIKNIYERCVHAAHCHRTVVLWYWHSGSLLARSRIVHRASCMGRKRAECCRARRQFVSENRWQGAH